MATETAPGTDTQAEHKRLFEARIQEVRSAPGSSIEERSQFLTEKKYAAIMETVQGWATMDSKARSENKQGYAYVKKYSVISIGGHDILVFNREEKKSGDTVAPVEPVALDQSVIVSHEGRMFADLLEAHTAIGHGKAKAFREQVKGKFGKSIPHWMQEEFLKLCPLCTRRQPRKTETAGHKPIMTVGFGTRGQIDLIDFQAHPDGSFKFLLNYQDHGIKLYTNVALTSKRNSAIAFALLEIFTMFGPPCILQADNGREFTNAADTQGGKDKDVVRGKSVQLSEEVRADVNQSPPACIIFHENACASQDLKEIVDEIKEVWPGCKLVHGRARHSQSQGGIERLNRTVEDKLGKWMPENKSKR